MRSALAGASGSAGGSLLQRGQSPSLRGSGRRSAETDDNGPARSCVFFSESEADSDGGRRTPPRAGSEHGGCSRHAAPTLCRDGRPTRQTQGLGWPVCCTPRTDGCLQGRAHTQFRTLPRLARVPADPRPSTVPPAARTPPRSRRRALHRAQACRAAGDTA